jgi:hypothetical protein
MRFYQQLQSPRVARHGRCCCPHAPRLAPQPAACVLVTRSRIRVRPFLLRSRRRSALAWRYRHSGLITSASSPSTGSSGCVAVSVHGSAISTPGIVGAGSTGQHDWRALSAGLRRRPIISARRAARGGALTFSAQVSARTSSASSSMSGRSPSAVASRWTVQAAGAPVKVRAISGRRPSSCHGGTGGARRQTMPSAARDAGSGGRDLVACSHAQAPLWHRALAVAAFVPPLRDDAGDLLNSFTVPIGHSGSVSCWPARTCRGRG